MNQTTQLPNRQLSRRTTLAAAGAFVGGALFHQKHMSSANAQTASPEPAPVSSVGHPVIGAWQWLWDAQNPDGPVTNGLFSEDGTYLDYDFDFKVINLGLWTPTSDRAADLVVISQQVILPDSLLDLASPLPESLIVPEMNRSRQSVEVDASGNLMTNHTQFVDADGQDLDAFYSHEIIGVRLTIEPEALAAARS